ncbi:MAG: translation initiation factor IF-2 N-terminal domain-containing protein, partial [Acidobacteriaceae bacterium]
MSTVRINELARELEVKSKEILDALTAVGVTEKKTHSSSIETDEAERVRTHILKARGGSGSAAAARHEADNRPKIDWSKVHSVGDVAKAILEKKQQEAHPTPARAATPAAAPVKATPQPAATMQAAAAKPAASATPAVPAASTP